MTLQRAAAPVMPEPVIEVEVQDGPGLFDDLSAATFQPEVEATEVAADDMPPPAYRPQPVAQAPRQAPAASHDADPGAFVAPRPRNPGTPSPEALARLQAAVSRAPAPGQQRAAQPMAAQRPAAPQPRPAADKPRFGINSLINRMTGHNPDSGERLSNAMRQQPQVSPYYEDEAENDPDRERIEIPAFLRRQAN